MTNLFVDILHHIFPAIEKEFSSPSNKLPTWLSHCKNVSLSLSLSLSHSDSRVEGKGKGVISSVRSMVVSLWRRILSICWRSREWTSSSLSALSYFSLIVDQLFGNVSRRGTFNQCCSSVDETMIKSCRKRFFSVPWRCDYVNDPFLPSTLIFSDRED